MAPGRQNTGMTQGEITPYSATARWLHWLIAAMIIGQLAGGVIMHKLGFSDLKVNLYQLHKSFGLVILALSLFRLVWRLTHRPPPLPEGMKPWERRVAGLTHQLFYVLMIGVPLVGWAMVSADPASASFPLRLFFVVPMFELPLPTSQALADLLEETHEILAKLTIGLLVLHVGAALKHQFVDHDNIFARILPGRRDPKS